MFGFIEISQDAKELFHIGKLTVYTYGFLIALGLLIAVVLFYFLCKKFKLSEKTFNFYTTTVFISIVLGFLMAALFQCVYDWIDSGFTHFPSSFQEIGMTFMGGLIGGAGTFLIITAIFAKGQVRTDFWKIANIIVPCIPLIHAFGRIGCLFAGCCYGLPSDSPIAVKYSYKPCAYLPTQIFESVFLFVLFGVMLFLLLKYKRIDLMLLIYLYGYSVWRFIIEFFRSDDRGAFIPGLTPSQFQSIVMLLIAVALTVYIYYFDRIPFAGKQRIGRTFREFALAVPEGDESAAQGSEVIIEDENSSEIVEGEETVTELFGEDTVSSEEQTSDDT